LTAHDDTERALRAWLDEFSACVRDVDYERAKAIFAPEVMGFGTYEAVVTGLDRLADDLWSRIWPTISGFRYLTEQLYWGAGGDVAWVACPWTSNGRDADGSTFPRPGRVTVGLRRTVKGRWLATHTHHSLYPRPA